MIFFQGQGYPGDVWGWLTEVGEGVRHIGQGRVIHSHRGGSRGRWISEYTVGA